MLEQVQDARIWMSFHLTRWLRPQQAVLLDGLVRGLGRKSFTLIKDGWGDFCPGWTQDCAACIRAAASEDGCCTEVQRLIERVDEVIRLAPSPLGISDFLIRIRVFKRPSEGDICRRRPDWRRLLAHEFCLSSEDRNYLISRYHDWKHGDARQRLATLLSEHPPTHDLPLVEVAITSIGQLLVDLVREQRISLDEG